MLTNVPSIIVHTAGMSFSPHSNPKKQVKITAPILQWQNGSTKRLSYMPNIGGLTMGELSTESEDDDFYG